MTIYYVPSVDCMLRAPVPLAPEGKPVSRYLRTYFVRATSIDDAVSVVQSDVERDGAVVSEMEPPDPRELAQLPFWLLPRLLVARGRGVCWRSGRAFYAEDHV